MDSWLTFETYQKQYPDSSLTEQQFSLFSVDAALFIEAVTRWTASLADQPEQLALLATCQAQLIHLAEQTNASWDGVTSVNNHGYSENYASGMDVQAYLGQQQQRIVEKVLSAPATRWMLSTGGVYRPPRRR